MSNSKRAKERRSSRSRWSKQDKAERSSHAENRAGNVYNAYVRAGQDQLRNATPGEFMRQIGLSK